MVHAMTASAHPVPTTQRARRLEIARGADYVARMSRCFAGLGVFALAVFLASPAWSQTPKALLQDPGVWGAFEVKEDGGTACYMAGQPSSSTPKNVRRGKIWLLVTHRPYRKVRDEVSIYIGYPFRKDSEVTVNIDGKSFKMFTDGETAWAPDAKADGALVAAMRAGNKMVIRGVSGRGTKTADTYSLKGFTKAHRAISRSCKG